MIKIISILVLFSLSCQAATKYVDFTGGSDANNGDSTATPYKRAYGMKGYTAGFTPSSGDTFIFKGGVTWPVTCFQMAVPIATVTYRGDVAWFSGGAYSNPVFDFQQTMVGPGWDLAAGVLVTANNCTFQRITLQNFRAPLEQNGISTWGSTTICLRDCNNFTLNLCVGRWWDQPLVGGTVPTGTTGGGFMMKIGGGTGHIASNSEVYQNTAVYRGGFAFWNIGTVTGCTIHDIGGSAVMSAQTVRNNHIYNLVTPMDPAAHANAIYMFTPGEVSGNLIHDTVQTAQNIYMSPNFIGLSGNVTAFNNVVYNTAVSPMTTDQEGPDSSGCGFVIYNNTLVAPGGANNCIKIGGRGQVFASINIRNNHFITSGTPVCYNVPASGCSMVTSVTYSDNLTQTLSAANAAGYVVANNFAPTFATSPTYNIGVDLSPTLTVDRLGVSRPQAAVWDIGAYEFTPTGPGAPGSIVFSASSGTVAENAGTFTVTAQRTGGSTGAISCSRATANGDAIAGVNYTTTGGSFSWGDGDAANKTVNIPILNVPFYGSKSFTFTISAPTGGATIGTPSTQTITINGVGSPPGPTLLSGTSWDLPSSLSPPFVQTGSYYSQPNATVLAEGGRALYYFTNVAATYSVYATVSTLTDGESGSDNSVWFALNNTPVDPDNIWDVLAKTDGVPATRPVSQRGPNGTYAVQDTNLVQVALEAGVTNVIEIVGREAGMKIYNIRIIQESPELPDPPTILATSITNINGYYKATTNIVALIPFFTNVNVTGTPTLALNSGGTLTNTGGSGTAVLVFEGTVQPGENSQALDYANTNSLALNGGTIRFGAVDANLTLPVPGQPGSLSYERFVVVDTTPPGIVISAPNVTLSPTGGTVFYAVTYSDTNFALNTLSAADVSIVGTSTATITVDPSAPLASGAVTLSALTNGTGAIQVAAGTAADFAGNLAPAAGPSAIFTVTSGGNMQVISVKAGLMFSRP